MEKIKRALIILITSILIVACNNEVELLSNVNQYRANKVISTLKKHNIESTKIANKKGETFVITVEKGVLSRSILILDDLALLAASPLAPKKPCEKEGLVKTPSEQRACSKYRLETDLQDTLSQIDGVILARVHIVIAENDSYKEALTPSSAAIFIKHLPDFNLNTFKISIKRLVEKSIADLTYDKVSLVLIPAMSIDNTTYVESKKKSNSTSTVIIVFLLFLMFFLWLAFFFREKLTPLKQRVLKDVQLIVDKDKPKGLGTFSEK